MSVHFPFFPADPQDLELFHHIDQTRHTGDSLGDHRCPGCPRHAHVQGDNKIQIQHNINNGRQHQEYHGSLTVAGSTDHACHDIIQIHSRDTDENNKNIIISPINNIRRCLHPDQNIPAQDCRHHGHNHGKYQSQPGTVRYILTHAYIISGTEFMRYRDGKSVTDTHAETDHQEVDRAGGTHCCQIIHAKKPSYDHGIYQIIELLE